MKLVRGLLAALVAVMLLVAGAAAALFTLDLGRLSPPLTRWASDQLQRPLVVDGPVSIWAGRTLRFSAEGIRLANTPWGSRGDMLRVGRLVVEIDAASLINRPVIVRRIELDGLDLLLERRADGASNWEFAPRSSDQGFTWPESLPLVVEDVALPDARIRFTGPRLDRPLDLHFDSLEQRRADGGMLGLAARGTANGEPVRLEARAGPFAGLVAGRDFRVALEGRLGELDVALGLRVDDIARPVNTELDLAVSGPGAEYLTTRFGVRNLGEGPLALRGRVRPSADGTGVEGDLAGEIGQFTIKARGALADPTVMSRLRAELEVEGPDLSFAGGLAGLDQLPAEPFRLTAAFERAGGQLRVDDATLTVADATAGLKGTVARYTELRGNDLEFRFRGADLGAFRGFLSVPSGLDGAFDISGTLKAGKSAELIDVSATTVLGQVRLSGPLGARPGFLGTRLDFAASGPSVARVGELAGLNGLPGGGFTASADVEWTADGAVIRQGGLEAGRDRLTVDGLVARQPLGPGTDITWRISGPDLAGLAAIFRTDSLPAGAFDLRGRLRREVRASRLDDVRGTVAGADVRLSGRVADQPKLGSTLDLSVEGPRLEAFGGLVPGYQLPPGKFRVTGGVAVTAKRVALSRLQVAVAGAEGTVDADIDLPLSAGRGEFRVTARGKDVARFLPRIGTGQVAAVPFDLRVRGRAQGGTWQLDEAEFSTDAGQVSGSGRLDWAPDFSATALKVAASTRDLSLAGRLVALDLPAQPFDLAAELTGTPTAVKVEKATGRLGTTDFDGKLRLDLGKRPVLDVDFRSDLLDLTPFFGEPAPPTAIAPAASPGPGWRRSSPRLIPDRPIPLGWLDRMDGSLAVAATRALFATVALDDLRVAGRLKDGTLTIDSLDMQAPPDGRLGLSGRIGKGARGATLQLAVTGTRVRLARLDDTPAVRDARPRADLEMEVTGEGATWRELAQSVDGGLRLTTGTGAIPARNMDLLFGGLWRDLVMTVVPGMASRDATQVRCMAAFVTATDGVLRTTPALVVQTERVNIITHGSIDLGTEQLELYLSTAPRRGRMDVTVAEIVNPYMKISGSLAAPGLGVDPKGVLFTGGAAVATAGISILAKGVWDRMFRAEDPCAVAAAEAAPGSGKEAPRKPLIPRSGSRH